MLICLGVAAISTSCMKDCTCETVTKTIKPAAEEGGDPSITTVKALATQTVKKGKCNELNKETTETAEDTGIQTITTVSCR